MPKALAELILPGADRVKSRSGMPEILAVNSIDPAIRADIKRPEGARMTERLSTISTYNSFDVCRTLERLHGIAGPLV